MIKRGFDTTQKDLFRIGRMRRSLMNENRMSHKDHTLPESVLKKEWKSIERKKQGAETVLRKSLEKLFTNQIQVFLKRLRNKVGIKTLKNFHSSSTKPEDFNLLIQTLLNWREWFNKTKKTSQRGVIIIVDNGYQTGLTRAGADPGEFTLPSETVDEIEPTTSRVSQERDIVANVINEIINQAAGTQSQFRRTATEQIQRGLSRGDSLQKIVADVAEKTKEQIGYKLDRIVQTAGNGGFEAGEIRGMLDAGITRGAWLSQRDSRVRYVPRDLWDHRQADGQESGLLDGWVIAGKGGRQETLRFPSDPLGSPGNTIYCRCSIRPLE